jgi:hypothetical protein
MCVLVACVVVLCCAVFVPQYFCVITSVTVGYGDFHPTTRDSKLFTIFFIPVTLVAFGRVLSEVTRLMSEEKTKHSVHKVRRVCEEKHAASNHAEVL